MNNHTPGPWTAVECCDSCPLPSGVAVAVQTDREPWTSIGRICSMTAQGDGKYDPSVTNANARLIAAAPELLAACELAIDLFQFGTFDNGVHSPSGESEAEHWAGRCREKMASAIAKAKGTS